MAKLVRCRIQAGSQLRRGPDIAIEVPLVDRALGIGPAARGPAWHRPPAHCSSEPSSRNRAGNASTSAGSSAGCDRSCRRERPAGTADSTSRHCAAQKGGSQKDREPAPGHGAAVEGPGEVPAVGGDLPRRPTDQLVGGAVGPELDRCQQPGQPPCSPRRGPTGRARAQGSRARGRARCTMAQRGSSHSLPWNDRLLKKKRNHHEKRRTTARD
jgi:hypothetical protein